MITRVPFAMLTLVALASYKAAESQRAESFDGFALGDKAGIKQVATDYGLPHPRKSDGLDLRARLPSSPRQVSCTMRHETIFEKASKEIL